MVPFTLAHGAAALPFRRLNLVPSGLLVGTFAPDFEYFLRLAPDDSFGHTLLGTFVLTLPLALFVLWLFHTFVKLPLARLLPEVIQRRLINHVKEFRFHGMARFSLIVVSILLGIATHLAWDSFTHSNTWLYHHWHVLGRTLNVPTLGLVPFYKVLQHGSTIIGISILSIWLVVRYRTSTPSCQMLRGAVSSTRKVVVFTVVAIVALMGGTIRAVAKVGIPSSRLSNNRFVGLLIVTATALAWWELVVYGVFSSRSTPAPGSPES